jgi:hypothetical protein
MKNHFFKVRSYKYRDYDGYLRTRFKKRGFTSSSKLEDIFKKRQVNESHWHFVDEIGQRPSKTVIPKK